MGRNLDRNSYRDRLSRMLVSKGFSLRKSEKAVNAVFEHMRLALARGETVEAPGGELRVVATHRKKTRRIRKLKDGRNGLRYKLTTENKQPNTVVLVPSPHWKETEE